MPEEPKSREIEHSGDASERLRALNDALAMIQQLRFEDLSTEEVDVLRQLLRELVSFIRPSHR